MSRRTEKVGEMLRRELAQIIIAEELGDPRLKPTASLSITAVRVSGDLGHARVFFDVLDASMDKARVAKGLEASRSRIRFLLRDRVQMRRLPELHFEWDASIERGQRMEQLFAELAKAREADDTDGAHGTNGADGAHGTNGADGAHGTNGANGEEE